MGYTHYWEYRPEAISPMLAMALCQDARQITEVGGVAITGWSGEGTEAPEFNPEGRLAFNGVQEKSHESFIIEFHAPQAQEAGSDFERHTFEKFIKHERTILAFCKTAEKPYDRLVTATLLRARELIPGFQVNSDGSWADWAAGRSLYFDVFGMEGICPWGEKN